MAEIKMRLVDWLDDLCVRFIINLPQEELESVERICFQVEEAQWFYEDFIRPVDPTLPSMSLRQFCLLIFQHCPLLASFSEYHHMAAFEEFLAYKTRVPVRGAIMLNKAMDEVLLVKGWKKNASWSFPRGKINKDETDLDCAVREAYEETGYDLADAGLVLDESKMKYIEVTMREQHMKLYVFRGVPQDVQFQPRTRKEISKISWYKLSNLPGYRKTKQQPQTKEQDALGANKLYMVAPFLSPLKKWIAQQRKLNTRGLAPLDAKRHSAAEAYPQDSEVTGDEDLLFSRAVGDEASKITLHSRHGPSGIKTATNPAAELKRLLAVGQQDSSSANESIGTEQRNETDLLALLRNSSAPALPATQMEVQHQSLEPIQMPATVPRSHPSQQHPNQTQPFNMASPPTFPFQPSHVDQARPWQGYAVPPPGGWNHNRSYLQPDASQAYAGPHGPIQHAFATNVPHHMPSLPSVGAPPLPPYQRTGDAQFARASQNSGPHAPSIPRAADLPQPKLSSHAMNLLSVFKGHAPQPTSPAELNTEASGKSPLMPPNLAPDLMQTFTTDATIGHRHTESRSRQALLQSRVESTETKPPQGPALSQQKLPSPPAARPSAHQSTLLDLFRAPSEAAHRDADKPGPRESLVPAPVELSAFPSPGIRSQDNLVQGPSQSRRPGAGSIRNNLSLDTARRNSSPQTPELTSATLHAPPKFPELGSVRRKPRPSKPSGEKPERQPPSAEPMQTPPAPIKILKRPHEAKKEDTQSKSPEAPAAVPAMQQTLPQQPAMLPSLRQASPVELRGSAPKPFQPQILRRPQTASTSTTDAAAIPTPEVTDPSRRSSAAEAQKQALLSLFSKSNAAQAPAAGRSPMVSPNNVARPPAPEESQRTSRISSIASETALAAAEDPRSRMGSVLAAAKEEAPAVERFGERANGRQTPTPISPSDKGFLLSYLEGVVKSAGH